MFTACSNADEGCRPCGHLADKQTDTVKVSLGGVDRRSGKENVSPGPGWEAPSGGVERRSGKEPESPAPGWEAQLAERRWQEEQDRIRQAREAQERHALEQRRREEEECAQRQREVEERHRTEQRQVEEERLRSQQLAEGEKRRREEEQRLRAEEQQLQQKLKAVLGGGGYALVDERKRKGGLSSGYKYQLHDLVKKNDLGGVRVLLRSGADATLEDSRKRTPLKLAEQLKRKEIISELSSIVGRG